MDVNNRTTEILKDFKKTVWINSAITLFAGLTITVWLYLNGDLIDLSKEVPLLETFYLKRLNEVTSIVIFFILALSVILNIAQVKSIYKILTSLSERIEKLEQDL